MPVEIYLKNKKTKTVCGPNLSVTLAHVDTWMRKDLGKPESESEWLGSWDQNLMFSVAMNVLPADIVENIVSIPNRAADARDIRWEVLDYLATHYLFGNNHGAATNYKSGKERWLDLKPFLDARREEYLEKSRSVETSGAGA